VTHVPVNRRDIGMVFQQYSLFPHLTVTRNVEFGLKMRHVAKDERATRIRDMLEIVGLEDLAERYPHELSGGQQQRIALARALVTRPRALLLDEPLAALDAKVRVRLRDQIRAIQTQLGITTVFVTHDQEEALAVSDRVAVMAGGRIAQFGTPEELYRRPANAFVANFVGVSNQISGVYEGDGVRVPGRLLPVIHAPEGATDGDRGTAFVRPEHVTFEVLSDAAASDDLNATVISSGFLAAIRRTVARLASGETIASHHGSNVEFAPVRRCESSFSANRSHSRCSHPSTFSTPRRFRPTGRQTEARS